MAATSSTSYARSSKPYALSLGSLTTLDVLECMSGSASDLGTATADEDGSPRNVQSEGAEASDTDADMDPEGGLHGDTDASTRAILSQLGFEPCITGEPLLPREITAPADPKPRHYQDLFWRTFHAAQRSRGKFSEANVAKHNEAIGDGAAPIKCVEKSRPRTDGEWLLDFKRHARTIPVKRLTARVFGNDIGPGVASFVGVEAGDNLSEASAGSILPAHASRGLRVVGARRMVIRTSAGRRGFVIEDDASIYTWECSSPSRSGVPSVCSDDDPPQHELLGFSGRF
uniref:Uncharacterized protein n=1 Tax=Alexandrium monilatum TaxID=311494 RepID=A0A7S4T3P0_9DINO